MGNFICNNTKCHQRDAIGFCNRPYPCSEAIVTRTEDYDIPKWMLKGIYNERDNQMSRL